MATEYYLILGITRDVSEQHIRRAYRMRSLQHHPAGATEADDSRLRQVDEAYETLGVPARRAEYDRQVGEDRPGMAPPRTSRRVLGSGPLDLFGSFATYRPSREAVVDAYLRAATGRHVPKSRRMGNLNLEVVLSPEEAVSGGVLPVEVPVARLCSRCDGTGRTGFFGCDACQGHGMLWVQSRIDVPVPRLTSLGAPIPVSLRHVGADSMCLNIHVRVSDA